MAAWDKELVKEYMHVGGVLLFAKEGSRSSLRAVLSQAVSPGYPGAWCWLVGMDVNDV